MVEDPEAAAAKPAVIIRKDGKYYVAVDLLEYDPGEPGLSGKQKAGVDDVAKLFKDNHKYGDCDAVILVPFRSGPKPLNTGW